MNKDYNKKQLLKRAKKALPIIISLLILIPIISAFSIYFRYNTKLTNSDLDKLNLESATKLMIVAHPDDETIWGGAHLLEGGYLVVCLTNKSNETRSNEFSKIMAASGNIGIMLDYPDKILGKRSNWTLFRNSINKNITTIINYKDWNEIVTHNPDGEYGHIHHKITNDIVTNVCNNTNAYESLYYFGKYYKKGTSNLSKNPITEDLLNRKKELLSLYVSQGFIDDYFGHMYPFENFQKASELE